MSSSNGKKEENELEKETEKAKCIFHHPVLCELADREGRFGPFQNFRLTRPYLDDEAKRKQSNWHTLNQNSLDQLRRIVDALQEELDEESAKKQAGKNGAASRPPSKKKKARVRASATH